MVTRRKFLRRTLAGGAGLFVPACLGQIYLPHRRKSFRSVSAPAGGYICDAADFDGSNDYMRKTSDLTGNADGKQGLFSCWVRLDGGESADIMMLLSSSNRFYVAKAGGNLFKVYGRNSAGTDLLLATTVTAYAASATWLHVLSSWKMDTAGARHIYINDVSDIAVTTFTDGDIDYTQTEHSVGAYAPSSIYRLNGCLADLYFAQTYLDLSTESNRRKFISATGKPVDLGSDGSTPTGTAPITFHHLDDGEAATNFAINRGSGGNFSITGSLDTASSSPSD